MTMTMVETAVYGCKCWLQFELYHVIAPLSFQRSISLASLFVILFIFGWSDLLQILRSQAAYSFAVLCIIMFYCHSKFPFLFNQNSKIIVYIQKS